MFTIKRVENEYHKCVITCSCGCSEVLLKTRTQDMNPYVFHENIKQVEYYECPNCGAVELKEKPIVSKLMGPQNFASRQGPQAQWVCACQKKVRYVNHGEPCKKCGNTEEDPFNPKERKKPVTKKVPPKKEPKQEKSWEVSNPAFGVIFPD